MTLKSAVEEAQSIKLLLQSIGVLLRGAINIHSESKSVLNSVGNPVHDLKRKHVEIAPSLVRESIATGVISLWKVDGKLNPSDPCTKALSRIPWSGHSERLLTNVLGL